MLRTEERHIAKESDIYPEKEFGEAHSVHLVRKHMIKPEEDMQIEQY